MYSSIHYNFKKIVDVYKKARVSNDPPVDETISLIELFERQKAKNEIYKYDDVSDFTVVKANSGGEEAMIILFIINPDNNKLNSKINKYILKLCEYFYSEKMFEDFGKEKKFSYKRETDSIGNSIGFLKIIKYVTENDFI